MLESIMGLLIGWGIFLVIATWLKL